MATTLIESGSDATFGTEFWTTTGVGGTVTSDSVINHAGPRSIQCNSGSAGNPQVRKGGVLGVNGRGSFYLYLDDLPVGDPIWPWNIQDAGPANGMFRAVVTPAGLLQLESIIIGSPFDLVTVSGSTLSTDTWYRISFAWTVTSDTIYTVKQYLNGVLDATVANTGQLFASVPDTISCGWARNTDAGSNLSLHMKHFYFDDSSSLTDIGNVRVTAKRPIALGTANAFDTPIGSSTNRWESVNERALSEAKGWQQAGSGQVGEYYTLQAASVGDVDLTGKTLVSRSAWMWAKATAGGSGTPGIMNNGSVTAKTLTASPALYTVITDSASYPSNTDGIGMRSSGTTDDVFLYECGTLIAYLEPSNTQRRTRSGLGTRTGTRQAH